MIAEERLENWGHWLRQGRAAGTAMSAEGGYLPPTDLHKRREARPQDPHAADAWDIEIACRLLPVHRHALLKMLYVYRLSGPRVIRSYRVQFGRRLTLRDLDAEEHVAKMELAERLALPAGVRIERAQALAKRELAMPKHVSR